jgi:hypothetical protein
MKTTNAIGMKVGKAEKYLVKMGYLTVRKKPNDNLNNKDLYEYKKHAECLVLILDEKDVVVDIIEI